MRLLSGSRLALTIFPDFCSESKQTKTDAASTRVYGSGPPTFAIGLTARSADRKITSEMGLFSEFTFAAAGALAVTFIIHWIVMPFLYGIPVVLYWTLRRYLKWRTPVIYSSRPILYVVIVFAAATMALSFLPHSAIPIVTNFWFASGVLIGLILWLGRIIIFKSVRSEFHYRLTECIKPYVTPKGRIALLALLSRW